MAAAPGTDSAPDLGSRNGKRIKVLSAGVAVVRRAHGQWYLLFLRAYQYWDFPKGKVEPGEGALEAARREVGEESGITELDFRWGEHYVETGPYAHGKLARYYVAETECEEIVLGISPELGRPEHHEYRWVTFKEGFRLASPRVRQVLKWLRKRLPDAG